MQGQAHQRRGGDTLNAVLPMNAVLPCIPSSGHCLRQPAEASIRGVEPEGCAHGHLLDLLPEGVARGALTHTFEPASGQTRYTRHVQIPLQGVFRLVGPVMKATGAADKRNARFAKNLKELLER